MTFRGRSRGRHLVLLLVASLWLLCGVGKVEGAVNDVCSNSGCLETTETCVANACTCSAGHEDANSDSTCTPCASGYFKSAVGTDSDCTQVRAGYYASASDDTDGEGIASAAVAESACPGIMQSDVGATACHNAPSGEPSGQPSMQPSMKPSMQPSSQPSSRPSSSR